MKGMVQLLRRLSAKWFSRRFARLRADMALAEVRDLVGKPNEVEQAMVPSGSVVGLQDGFVHKIPAGDPYLQWMFRRGDRTFVVFFAQVGVDHAWKLSWKISYPSVVDGMADSR
jgi:hypothetical protein